MRKFFRSGISDYVMLAQELCYDTAKKHGWWDEPRDDLHLIALMHSELSEAVEWIRHGNGKSDHIPEFTGVEEELADCIIRILDYAAHNNLKVGAALVAKMEFNETRPYRHGGKKA